MTRDEAREHWKTRGLSYSDLTKANVIRLRQMIDTALRASGLIKGFMAENQILRIGYERDGSVNHVDLRCRAYYFRDRQAVTFEPNGFIGFAGWADDNNVQPILSAFISWVDEIAPVAKAA